MVVFKYGLSVNGQIYPSSTVFLYSIQPTKKGNSNIEQWGRLNLSRGGGGGRSLSKKFKQEWKIPLNFDYRVIRFLSIGVPSRTNGTNRIELTGIRHHCRTFDETPLVN